MQQYVRNKCQMQQVTTSDQNPKPCHAHPLSHGATPPPFLLYKSLQEQRNLSTNRKRKKLGSSVKNSMAKEKQIFLLLLLMLLAVLTAQQAAATVTSVVGNVYCDSCGDGSRGLFDLPVSGATVALECDGRGDIEQQKTDLLGNFHFSFNDQGQGRSDLSACGVRVVQAAPGSKCSVPAAERQPLKLVLHLFFYDVYAVAASLRVAPPAGVTLGPWCPSPLRPPSSPLPPPAVTLPPPVVTLPPPAVTLPPSAPAPPVSWACPSAYWMGNACEWRLLKPETPLWAAFGVGALRRYASGMSLRAALRGRGNVYAVLAREATAALLNSYQYGPAFRLSAVEVVYRFNVGLQGPDSDALLQAWHLRRANSGAPCRLHQCPAPSTTLH